MEEHQRRAVRECQAQLVTDLTEASHAHFAAHPVLAKEERDLISSERLLAAKNLRLLEILVAKDNGWQSLLDYLKRNHQHRLATKLHVISLLPANVPLIESGKYDVKKDPFAKGGFAYIHSATLREHPLSPPKAVKVLNEIGPELAKAVEEISKEMRFLISLRHRHIVTVDGFLELPADFKLIVGILMEEADRGSLESYRKDVANAPLSETQKFAILNGVADGLSFLHENKVVHRDLKPANILLFGRDCLPKLTDFGISEIVHRTLKNTYVGNLTWTYTPPELLEFEQSFNLSADVYSLAVIIYELFTELSIEDELGKGSKCAVAVLRGRRPTLFSNPPFSLPHSLKLVVQSAWTEDIHQRPSVGDVKIALLQSQQQQVAVVTDLVKSMSVVGEGAAIPSGSQAAKRIFAVGGKYALGNDGLLRSIDIFDFASNTWHPAVTGLPGSEREGLAVVPFKGRLYAFGGNSRGAKKDRVDVYDDVHSTWSSAVKMPTPREGHSACLFQNRLIVVIGGWNDRLTLSSVDAFDPLKNEWTSMSSMMTKRRYFAVIVLGGDIYAIGGYEADEVGEYKPVSSVEKFDGIRWSSVASMKNRRSCHCAAVLDNTIFVFGGVDENRRLLSSVESFSIESGEWRIHDSSPMPVVRQAASAIAYEGRIYVFGGWNGTAYVDTMDIFNPSSNKWETMASKMTTPRAWAGNVLM